MPPRPLVRPSPQPSRQGVRLAKQITVAAIGVLVVAAYLVYRWFLACGFVDACVTAGLCTTEGGMCVAADDADCRQAEVCRQKGYCAASEGKCVAARDEDCKQSEWCKQYGMCSIENHDCIAATDDDCKRSEMPEATAVRGEGRNLRDVNCVGPAAIGAHGGGAVREVGGSAPQWIRTTGLRLRRPTLYPAELVAQAARGRSGAS